MPVFQGNLKLDDYFIHILSILQQYGSSLGRDRPMYDGLLADNFRKNCHILLALDNYNYQVNLSITDLLLR